MRRSSICKVPRVKRLKTTHVQGALPGICTTPRQPTAGPDVLNNTLFLAQMGTRLVLDSPFPALKGACHMRST